jgi:hypothetical protein
MLFSKIAVVFPPIRLQRDSPDLAVSFKPKSRADPFILDHPTGLL